MRLRRQISCGTRGRTCRPPMQGVHQFNALIDKTLQGTEQDGVSLLVLGVLGAAKHVSRRCAATTNASASTNSTTLFRRRAPRLAMRRGSMIKSDS